jgi:hypothetical protein
MTNRGRKELNTIDGKESITKTNEHSDNNVQNYYHDLGEAIVLIVGLDEIVTKMNYSSNNQQLLDDEDSVIIQRSDHGDEVGNNLDITSEGNIEGMSLLGI